MVLLQILQITNREFLAKKQNYLNDVDVLINLYPYIQYHTCASVLELEVVENYPEQTMPGQGLLEQIVFSFNPLRYLEPMLFFRKQII